MPVFKRRILACFMTRSFRRVFVFCVFFREQDHTSNGGTFLVAFPTVGGGVGEGEKGTGAGKGRGGRPEEVWTLARFMQAPSRSSPVPCYDVLIELLRQRQTTVVVVPVL